MCQLLAMNCNVPTDIVFSFTGFAHRGGRTDTHHDGWGIAFCEARDAFERMYFEHHLGREGGSMTRVAEKTGLERTHLYRKLKQLGVEPGKLGKKSAQ